MINWLDFNSNGFPDSPPFWCFDAFCKFSLLPSVVLETIIALTWYFNNISLICWTWFSETSGEIFTTIGTFDFKFVFSCSMEFNSSSSLVCSWKFLKFSVFGDEIFIAI